MHNRKEIARKAVRLLVRKLPKDKKSLISTGEFINTERAETQETSL